MDIVIMPQLQGGGGGRSTDPRYRLVEKVPRDYIVELANRTRTKVEVDTSSPINFRIPARAAGYARDFAARLVVAGDDIPRVTFLESGGETVRFEGDDGFEARRGINLWTFSETDDGFITVTYRHDYDFRAVVFDARGGTAEYDEKAYLAGARYGTLPTATREGYEFEGWFDAAEGGTRQLETDVYKGISGLYAHWKAVA